MRLNQDQIEMILEHIDRTWYSRVCPLCRKDNWTLSETVWEARDFRGGLIRGGLIGGGAVTPFVTFTCQNCGYTVILNAVNLGIINKSAWEG